MSLAAIGYHCGTKDDLLTAALYQALANWGDDLHKALTAVDHEDAAGRFEAMWTQVIRSFADNHRLWAVQFELLAFPDGKTRAQSRFREDQRGGMDRAGGAVRRRGRRRGVPGADARGAVAGGPGQRAVGAHLRDAVRTIAAAVA